MLADDKACKWVERNADPIFGFNRFTRMSWTNCVVAMEDHCATVEWEREPRISRNRRCRYFEYSNMRTVHNDF